MLPDVAGAGRAEDGVDDRVQHGVGVGMAGQAAALADAHAAEDQPAVLVERVDVDAVADAHHGALNSSKCASAYARSSGRVILKFAASPGTTRTS